MERQPLSRKERRRIARERAGSGKDTLDQGRRNLLKMIIPLGWVPEVRRKGGISNLSTHAKVSLVKDIGLVGVATGVAVPLVKEAARERTLKEKVLAFTWEDAKDEKKLRAFTENLANGYVELTQTTRIKKEELVDARKIRFFTRENDFLQEVAKLSPQLAVLHQRGYADYTERVAFINLEALQRDSKTTGSNAGLELVQAIWHEWGHLDIEPRTVGKYINNPKAVLRPSANMPSEIIRRYHGGIIESDSYQDDKRFEEVWLETVIFRMIADGVGLEELSLSKEYFLNGVDVLASLTRDISYKKLYEMHATSDFEEFARLIGQKLPGNQEDFVKGERLFAAINSADYRKIEQTGATRR